MWRTGAEASKDFKQTEYQRKWKGYEKTWTDLENKTDGSGKTYLSETLEKLTKDIK